MPQDSGPCLIPLISSHFVPGVLYDKHGHASELGVNGSAALVERYAEHIETSPYGSITICSGN